MPTARAPDAFEEAADLLLEDDGQRDEERREGVVQEPAEDGQVEGLDEDDGDDDDDKHAAQHRHRGRAFDE